MQGLATTRPAGLSTTPTCSRVATALVLGILLWGASATLADDDPGNSGYSSLSQITRKNVWRLERAWTWRRTDGDAALLRNSLLLPDAAGGALVFCTPPNGLVALDPITGNERWRAAEPAGERPQTSRQVCPGFTYWYDSQASAGAACAHRILAGAGNGGLFAIDGTTGKPCGAIANEGRFSGPPAVVKDVAIVAVSSAATAPATSSVRGFDVRSGKFRWRFDAVAADTKPEIETEIDAHSAGSALPFDRQRDLVFVATGAASPDWSGTVPRDDPFASAIVALRATTGQVVWHFQTIHRDFWSWDALLHPLLVDVPKGGRRVPAVAVVTRQSLLFVLDRDTGQPLFPVEERPVPTDGMLSATLAKTQPFPATPPLVDTRLSPTAAWGLTYWDENRCRDRIASARHGEVFPPPNDAGWINYPAAADNMPVGRAAVDAERNLLITPLARIGQILTLSPTRTTPDANGASTRWTLTTRPLVGPTEVPCTPPPWSVLVGVDLATGAIKWSTPLRVPGRLGWLLPGPAAFDVPVTGKPLVTAGNLIFLADAATKRLRAFDTETGVEIWSTSVGDSSPADPRTYARDGRQFLVAATDRGVVAYALPTKYLDAGASMQLP